MEEHSPESHFCVRVMIMSRVAWIYAFGRLHSCAARVLLI